MRQMMNCEASEPSSEQTWASLTRPLIELVCRQLSEFDLIDVSLVCRPWSAVAKSCISRVYPHGPCPDVRNVCSMFPNVSRINLQHCRNYLTGQHLEEMVSLCRGPPCLSVQTLELVGCEYLVSEDLDLSSCRTLGMPNLRALDISGAQGLGDDFLACLGALPHLTALTMRACRWATAQSMLLLTATAPNLTQLDVSACPSLSDAALTHIRCLTNLSSLALSGCLGLSTTSLRSLSTLTALQSLDLSGLGDAHNKDLDLQLLAGNLTHLDISHSAIMDLQSMLALSSLTNLRSLLLDGCPNVTSSVLKAMSTVTSLETLSVRGCKLTFTLGLPILSTFSKLTTLYLTIDCWATASFANVAHLVLVQHPNLRELHMHLSASLSPEGIPGNMHMSASLSPEVIPGSRPDRGPLLPDGSTGKGSTGKGSTGTTTASTATAKTDTAITATATGSTDAARTFTASTAAASALTSLVFTCKEAIPTTVVEAMLGMCPHLQHLKLKSQSVGDTELRLIPDLCPKLESLDLSSSSVSNTGLPAVLSLRGLTRLLLLASKVTMAGAMDILGVACPSIRELGVDGSLPRMAAAPERFVRALLFHREKAKRVQEKTCLDTESIMV